MNNITSNTIETRVGKLLTPKVLSLAIASTTLCAPLQAEEVAALEAEKQILEEIKVTGIRRSLIKSIDVKRFSDTVVEVISADDIGGLPDVSIADALTRLPGVTAVRTGGQASELNIRGLSGDFVFSTLNGREQVTTGGSRSIEFDQYPSELITQAAVYKSPKASLIEGGVAGTVELKTANPLSNDKTHTLSMSLRGMMNDASDEIEGADKYGYRVSASYQGKFMDDTLGFAAGYARLFQPGVANQFIGFKYQCPEGQVNGSCPVATVSEGFEAQQKGGEETRDGYMASLQWEPNDNFSLQSDLFFSEFDSETFARGYRVKTLGDGTITNQTVIDGALTGATVSTDGSDNFAVFTVNDNVSRYTQVLSGGINGTWSDGPWTIIGDISSSKSDGEFINGGTRALLYNDATINKPVRAPETISYLLNGLNVASFTANQSYTDLNTMALTQVGTWPYINSNELIAYKFDIKYAIDAGFISSIDVGIRYSEREFNGQRKVAEYGSEFGNNITGEVPLRITADMASIVGFSGDLSGFPDFLMIDYDRAVAAVNAANAAAGRAPFVASSNWGYDWSMIQTGSVNEDVLAGYVQINFETTLFGIDVTGNLGTRVVKTDQSSRGVQQVSAGSGTPLMDDLGITSLDFVNINVGQTYTDNLPSLNLNFHLTQSDQLRFAAAKVMSRAPIHKLMAGAGSWIDDSDNTFNAWSHTSPLLDPFYATQFDLSFEHYFEETDGVIAIALFYKDIESFINDFTIDPYDFAADGNFIIPEINPNTGKAVVTDGGQYETAINNDNGGYIVGLELGYTQTFDFLPGILSGLGVSASYSYTESEVEFQMNESGSSIDIPLPGLSENVLNATVFYDFKNFSTRLSMRYRDSYISKQVGVEPELAFFEEETVVDYQASYTLDNGINFVFQVNNLTDEPSKTYFGNTTQTGTLQSFGRQVFLGLNYSL